MRTMENVTFNFLAWDEIGQKKIERFILVWSE